MILRRLSQSIKEQNWSAIAIEFVLIIAGVFLGIQVSNWNDSRRESIQAAVYLKNLAEDIRSDIDEIDETVAVSRWRMSIMAALLEKSTGEPLPTSHILPIGKVAVQKVPAFTDAENRSVGLAYAYIRTIDGNRSTYDAIINTGGIGLAQDDDLLERIQTYYADVDEIKDIERKHQIDCDNALTALHEAGASPVDMQTIDELSGVIARNPKLLASTKSVWGSTGNQISILLVLRQQAEELVMEIEKGQQP